MSDPLSQIKAKLLLEELNRRNRWFEILRRNRGSSPWGALVPSLITLFAAVLIWQSFNSEQVSALVMLAIALVQITGVDDDGVHRRVDALIQLLQQEGMLQSTLPVSRDKQQPDTPPAAASQRPSDEA